MTRLPRTMTRGEAANYIGNRHGWPEAGRVCRFQSVGRGIIREVMVPNLGMRCPTVASVKRLDRELRRGVAAAA